MNSVNLASMDRFTFNCQNYDEIDDVVYNVAGIDAASRRAAH